MSYPNRAVLRASLETDLKSMVITDGTKPLDTEAPPANVVHVFRYLKKDPQGISPFACIDSGNVQYDVVRSDAIPTSMVIIIGFWVRRGNADEHDTMLDNLAQALATMLKAKYSSQFVSKSITDYEEMDGISYKFELHFVEFSI